MSSTLNIGTNKLVNLKNVLLGFMMMYNTSIANTLNAQTPPAMQANRILTIEGDNETLPESVREILQKSLTNEENIQFFIKQFNLGSMDKGEIQCFFNYIISKTNQEGTAISRDTYQYDNMLTVSYIGEQIIIRFGGVPLISISAEGTRERNMGVYYERTGPEMQNIISSIAKKHSCNI